MAGMLGNRLRVPGVLSPARINGGHMSESKTVKRYDVVICEDATGDVVAVIGTDLDKKHMEKRIETGLMRIDCSRFHVKEVPAGTGKVST
jgi:hypothetical protein